ncbi:MAG: Ldh family oxidoreductase [Acidimicrobiia bacterium]|nr:Ldh family oxidoreductase [Acidimicrobiia bacterium]
MATDARFDVPADLAVRVPEATMRATARSLFQALGMRPQDADRAADVLLYADLRGIDSHGVANMFPFYVQWLRSGHLDPRATPKVVRQAPATATIDDHRGLGLATCHDAMALAVDKARTCGLGSVAVTNSGHFGAAAYWAAMALERDVIGADMIGVAMTVGGLLVAPTYGAKAMVGLNPLAIAVPAKAQPPFVFDGSMSSVAGNKIRIARRLGATVAPGWIAHADGTPIMEEAEVPEDFLMLPLGGTREIGSHKGYSLAVMVDVLSGVLSGTGAGFLHPGDVSHHFLAYRVDAFRDADDFRADMDAYLQGLRDCPTAPGHDRVLYAGLYEHETEADRRANGIPYHPDVLAWFRAIAAELGAKSEL